MAAAGDQPSFWIEALGPNHNRAAFSCGVAALDLYLQKQAGQDFKKHVAVCFVLTPDGTQVAGYYTLSQYAAQLADVPGEISKKLPKYPLVPTTLIGRLAVSIAFRGQDHGETLLMDALFRTLKHSKELASAGAIVDALDSAAASFYKKYGFLELPNVSRRLFLPVGTIEALFR